jgi:excisionase family DNA binding protein
MGLRMGRPRKRIEWLTISEISTAIGCHRNTIHVWVRAGALTPKQVGNKFLINVDQLRSYLQRNHPEAVSYLEEEIQRRKK